MIDQPICWVDVETTGLDEYDGYLLECAIILSRGLEPLAAIKTLIKPDPDVVLTDVCDNYVFNMHTKNGLLRELSEMCPFETINSCLSKFTTGVHLLLTEHFGDTQPILAGSNPEFDRRWLKVFLPEIAGRLHYRCFDMNTLYLWDDVDKNSHLTSHRAMDDLKRDIDAARKLKKMPPAIYPDVIRTDK